jgi:purine-binding chemotaxis protein CheW
VTGEPSEQETRGWETLARVAALRESEDGSALMRELLVFTLDGDPYAVPVERVREIVRLRPITSVPRVGREIRGVISLRGEVVQVMALRTRLGLPPAPATRKSRIIVLHGDDGEVTGLIVDGVSEVLRVDEDEIQPPPGGESPFVAALCAKGGAFVSLINLDRVMDLDAG